MLFLRFQDALAGERWAEALGLCSERVRSKAAESSSTAAFFKDSVPIDLLLAQDFGCWSCSTNGYGLFVTVSPPRDQPVLQWNWRIAPSNGVWLVDFLPMKLDEYLARKKAAKEERERKSAEVRARVQSQVPDVQVRLVPVSERFVVGSPMLLRLELVNHEKTPVHYMAWGLGHHPLKVVDPSGKPLSFSMQSAQIGAAQSQVAEEGTKVLADRVDLQKHYPIKTPGRYTVQFGGQGLQIGQLVPAWDQPLFDEEVPQPLEPFVFVGLTNRFLSEPITIDVVEK
jgi:hypothetical protein